MKNKSFALIASLVIAFAILMLNSCSKIWNIDRTPDESSVLKRPPLFVPPDFHLPPPQEKQFSIKEKKSTGKLYKSIKPNPNTSAKNLISEGLTVSDQIFIKNSITLSIKKIHLQNLLIKTIKKRYMSYSFPKQKKNTAI